MTNLNISGSEPVDKEGAIAKADLYKLATYSFKLFKKISDDEQLEGWVQAKITKAADYIASVYHFLEYEKKFSEYGQKLEDSEMYTEEQKAELRVQLNEAKEKIKELKKAQAKKMSYSAKNESFFSKKGSPEIVDSSPKLGKARTEKKGTITVHGEKPSINRDPTGTIRVDGEVSKLPKKFKKLPKGEPEIVEGRETSNFTSDDISKMSAMGNIDNIRKLAIDLISTPSDHPMKPEKIKYFKEKIATKTTKEEIVKLMYDLLLSGEGLKVSGTRYSTNDSSYRKRFDESRVINFEIIKVGKGFAIINPSTDERVKVASIDEARAKIKEWIKLAGLRSHEYQISVPHGVQPKGSESSEVKLWVKKLKDQFETQVGSIIDDSASDSVEDMALDLCIDNNVPEDIQHKVVKELIDKYGPGTSDLDGYNFDLLENEKPSAGLTKKQKSNVVKDAKAGKDIGKPGKHFKDVEKAAKEGGAKDPAAVAAAAMWKNKVKSVKETKTNESMYDKDREEKIIEYFKKHKKFPEQASNYEIKMAKIRMEDEKKYKTPKKEINESAEIEQIKKLSGLK